MGVLRSLTMSEFVDEKQQLVTLSMVALYHPSYSGYRKRVPNRLRVAEGQERRRSRQLVNVASTSYIKAGTTEHLVNRVEQPRTRTLSPPSK
jgi:molybdopterin-guanine dinucleotide biosynthesis protein A